jgi:hypothetical protein
LPVLDPFHVSNGTVLATRAARRVFPLCHCQRYQSARSAHRKIMLATYALPMRISTQRRDGPAATYGANTMHTAKQIKAARTLASKLAALADPARNSNENERAAALAKLIAHCAKYGFELAEYAKPVASPDAGETVNVNADGVAERAAANRAFTAKHYAGPSQASHAKRAPKLADALARVANPVQRAKACSTRDESGLLLADSLADANGTFCPLAGTFDLGVLSRLASLSYLTVAGERIAISKAGRDLAANLRRKAA